MLRDRSPLGIATPFDLHFLGTPQAFVLSQDQTLRKRIRPNDAEASSGNYRVHFSDTPRRAYPLNEPVLFAKTSILAVVTQRDKHAQNIRLLTLFGY